MERYLYRFGYQAADQLDSDREDSRCVWIMASNESEALSWGRKVADRFVADRWPNHPSWIAGNYAHWIETQDEIALQWAAENAPCCVLGEFPTWTD